MLHCASCCVCLSDPSNNYSHSHVGQAAYGAANAFLDGLMEQCARAGQTGVSVIVLWPAVSGVGKAAAAMSREARVAWRRVGR